MNRNVILFCPVRQDPEILDLVLKSHADLEGVSEWWYIDDNEDSASTAVMAQHKRVMQLRGKKIRIFPTPYGNHAPAYRDHQWNTELISRIAGMRHMAILQMMQFPDIDGMLMVDSDLVLHPETAEFLAEWDDIEGNPCVVSEVFWTKWSNWDHWMPQVWDKHPYDYHSPQGVLRLADPGSYEVGGLGALTFIPREAVERGASYIPIPTLPWEGEDRHFCVRATAGSVHLMADTHRPAFHIYRKEQLPEAIAWQAAGCPPDYFRHQWLNEDWRKSVTASVSFSGSAPSSRKKIACFTPGEKFHWTWLLHWTQMQSELQSRHHVLLHFGYTSNVYLTRDGFAEAMRTAQNRPDYLLWVDDDQIVDYDHVGKLLSVLESDPSVDMACGWTVIYPEGSAAPGGWTSCGYEDGGVNRAFRKDQLGGVQEVDWTGFPLVVMRMSALDKAGPHAFYPLPASALGLHGEDTAFCRRLREAGGKIVVDSAVYVPHLKLQALVADLEKVSQ